MHWCSLWPEGKEDAQMEPIVTVVVQGSVSCWSLFRSAILCAVTTLTAQRTVLYSKRSTIDRASRCTRLYGNTRMVCRPSHSTMQKSPTVKEKCILLAGYVQDPCNVKRMDVIRYMRRVIASPQMRRNARLYERESRSVHHLQNSITRNGGETPPRERNAA